MAPLVLSTVAFAAAILAMPHFWVAFACLTLANVANAFLPAFWAIPYTFLSESSAASSTGLINSIGNLGGLVAPSVIGYFLDRTDSFTPGFVYVIAGLLVAIVLVQKLPARPAGVRAPA